MPSSSPPTFPSFLPNALNLPDRMVGFLLCVSGHSRVRLHGEAYDLQRGQLHIVSPLIERSIVEQSDDYVEIPFLTRMEVIYPLFQRIVEVVASLDLPRHPVLTLTEADLEHYLQAFQQWTALQEQLEAMRESPLFALQQLRTDHYIQQLLLDTLHRYALHLQPDETMARSQSSSQVGYKFLILLNLHFTQHRNVQFYAQQLGLSTGHFTALVRTQTGRTPSAWIAIVTMTQARQLLRTTAMSIKEIASALGFPEQYTFRKFFKHHEGLSPKGFRQQAQKMMPSGDK